MENYKRYRTLIFPILAALVMLGCNDYADAPFEGSTAQQARAELGDSGYGGYDTGAVGGDSGYTIDLKPVRGPAQLQSRDSLVNDKLPQGVEFIAPDMFDDVGVALMTLDGE